MCHVPCHLTSPLALQLPHPFPTLDAVQDSAPAPAPGPSRASAPAAQLPAGPPLLRGAALAAELEAGFGAALLRLGFVDTLLRPLPQGDSGRAQEPAAGDCWAWLGDWGLGKHLQ